MEQNQQVQQQQQQQEQQKKSLLRNLDFLGLVFYGVFGIFFIVFDSDSKYNNDCKKNKLIYLSLFTGIYCVVYAIE